MVLRWSSVVAGGLKSLPYRCGTDLEYPTVGEVFRAGSSPAERTAFPADTSERCPYNGDGPCGGAASGHVYHLAGVSSLARASSWAVLVSSRAEKIFTVFSAKVRSLLFSSMVFMIRAATGAQLPFSMKATVRFW